MSGRAGRMLEDRDRLLALFDQEVVGPSAGVLLRGGGGLIEGDAGPDAMVYRPGGAMTVAEMRELGAGGDMSSYVLAGGARRRRTRRRQRGGAKRRRATGRNPAFRLNLRAQIRLRH